MFFVVLVHGVLKWLHHPLLKNAILLHSESFRYKLWHSFTLVTLPGERSMYTSPLSVSHITFESPCSKRMTGAAVVVVGAMVVVMGLAGPPMVGSMKLT